MRSLLIVGPATSEWNLLRETDGERFVAVKEEYGFSGEFVSGGTAISPKLWIPEIENEERAIIYSLARELFAFANRRLCEVFKMNFTAVSFWTTASLKKLLQKTRG